MARPAPEQVGLVSTFEVGSLRRLLDSALCGTMTPIIEEKQHAHRLALTKHN
jgi:hypothetical protein